MVRAIAFLLVCLLSVSLFADPPPPLVEKYLHEGKYSEGETALLLVLDQNPQDDETRFGLGVLQFMHAVENLGQALFEYGAMSSSRTAPLVSIPVPRNPNPAAISHQEFGRVLDGFANQLRIAEATLAKIEDDNVKLRLRLAKIQFDFGGPDKTRSTLVEVLAAINGRDFYFLKTNPEFRIHFDRGDVAWLRAYCHLLCAIVEGYRAADQHSGFADRMKGVFPKLESTSAKNETLDWQGVAIVDAPRLRRAREHMVSVCTLNTETWHHIRLETDDDFEWLPHPKQTDILGMPLSNKQIDSWLAMMKQWEGLFEGERLLTPDLVAWIFDEHDLSLGLNVRKVFDDPPADLLNWSRIREHGIAAKYLEALDSKEAFDVVAISIAFQLFSGPFGFVSAARMN